MRTLFSNEHVTLTLEQSIETGLWMVHLNMTTWSHQMYKQYLVQWMHILQQLNSEGIQELYSCLPADGKAQKLIRMFGFKKLAVVDGKIIQRIETCVNR